MCEILLELEERETVYAGVLSVQALKDESYSSYNLARSREASGKSRRRPQGTA